MADTAPPDTTIYKVVFGPEQQAYTIWPADEPNPIGWNDVGVQGSKAVCLAWIQQNYRHTGDAADSPKT